jgi:hypothetical protein
LLRCTKEKRARTPKSQNITAFLLEDVTPGGVYTLRYKQSSLSAGGGSVGLLKYSIVLARISPVPENCWMHEGLIFWACRGLDHGAAASGGAKRKGGDFANGTPRYAFAEAVNDGWFEGLVVVPIITPDASVTVGPFSTGAEMTPEINEHSRSALLMDAAMHDVISEVGKG